MDGDWISEIFQANGAGGFAGEEGSGVGCSHGAPRSTERERRFPSHQPQGFGVGRARAELGVGGGGGGPSPNGCIPYKCALNICVGVLVCMG